jgi:hypothetical protein
MKQSIQFKVVVDGSEVVDGFVQMKVVDSSSKS